MEQETAVMYNLNYIRKNNNLSIQNKPKIYNTLKNIQW